MIMESLSHEEENINKDIKNIFRLEKETKTIKDRILRDIKNLFEYEEDYYHKRVKVNNFRSNNYIEYKSKGDRKALSIEAYLNKITPYLSNIINDLENLTRRKSN